MEKELLDAILKIDDNFDYLIVLEPSEAIEFCKNAKDYNDFSQADLINLIENINKIILPMKFQPGNPNNGLPHHTYRIGNENSRVIYLEIRKSYMPMTYNYSQLIKQLSDFGKIANADECSVSSNNQSEFIYRFWWD